MFLKCLLWEWENKILPHGCSDMTETLIFSSKYVISQFGTTYASLLRTQTSPQVQLLYIHKTPSLSTLFLLCCVLLQFLGILKEMFTIISRRGKLLYPGV